MLKFVESILWVVDDIIKKLVLPASIAVLLSGFSMNKMTRDIYFLSTNVKDN